MKLCKMGVWDESIPGINFDKEGISNYAKIQMALMKAYPRGEKGKNDWQEIVKKVKASKRANKYDCVVGVSGGVDSSFLLYMLKAKYNLNPLAVNLDNGWNSDIAVKNIKKVTKALNVDLETYVINYEEIKDLMRSYMYSGLPWIDTPTDSAIKSVMYKLAREIGVKYIFRGNDFRSEGKQPTEWTYSDYKQLKFIHKKFGKLNKLKTYPYLSLYKIIINGLLFNIKDIRPFYYLEYDKSNARKFLEKEFDWQYYGGHHHENLFTKFVMSYWLPEKFGIDKRKINLSAQIMSGHITKKEALEELSKPVASKHEFIQVKEFILSKLDFSDKEFEEIWVSENKTYLDYPSNYKLMEALKNRFGTFIKLIYPQKPMTFIAMEVNQKERK